MSNSLINCSCHVMLVLHHEPLAHSVVVSGATSSSYCSWTLRHQGTFLSRLLKDTQKCFFQTCCHFSQTSALIFPVESSCRGRCEGRTALCRHIHHEPPITTESSLLSQSSCADSLWDFEACPSNSLHSWFGCLSCLA